MDFDICHNRHRGNPESVAAHATGQKAQDRERVYRMIQQRGWQGATVDEVAVALGRDPNQISGRFSELKADGRIRKTPRRRATRTGASAAVCVVNGEP